MLSQPTEDSDLEFTCWTCVLGASAVLCGKSGPVSPVQLESSTGFRQETLGSLDLCR